MNPFSRLPQADFKVVASDGTVRSTGKGVFAGKQIFVFDPNLQVLTGDEIRRTLPNGIEEAFEVIDPQYFDAVHSIPANFQIEVRRKGSFEAGKGGNYSINVSGHNARVNVNSTDNSTNIVNQRDVFGDIAAEIQSKVSDESERTRIIQAVASMKEMEGKPGFKQAYREFMGVAADHLGVILPFLPALTAMLPG